MRGEQRSVERCGIVPAVLLFMWIAVLLVAGVVLLILAGLNVPSSKVSLGWLGLACIALVFLIERWPG